MRFSNSCRRNSSRSLRLALVGALILGLPGFDARTSAQEADGAPEEGERVPSLVEHSEVKLALLEAVVLDRRGRHLKGVDRELFELYSDGERVPIVTFDEIDLVNPRTLQAALPESVAETLPGSVGAESKPTPEALADPVRRQIAARDSEPRWFVMVFDGYNNISALRMSQVRKAAKKWVYDHLRPQDMVAVFEMNPYLSSIMGFTDDRPLLYRSIDKARIFPGTSIAEELMTQKLEGGERLSQGYLEQSLINATNFGQDMLRAERDQYYNNIGNIADAMVGLSGTRAILLFSGGFPLTRARTTAARGGFTVRFKQMLEKLEDQGIRVFTYDIGEEGGFTDASERTNYRIALDDLGLGTEWLDRLQLGNQISANNAHHEILSVLGSETGGRFFRGHDYRTGLEAANDDLSHYYLIGYRPQDVKRHAKKRGYAPLTLKVNEKGAKVVSRKGSHLPDLKSRPTSADLAARQRPSASTGAAELGTPVADLRVDCHPVFYPAPGGKTLAVLPIHVRGEIPTAKLGQGLSALDLQLTVLARRNGETLVEGTRDVKLRFPDGAAESFDNGLQLRDAVILPASSEELELHAEVKLRGFNRIGTWTEKVSIPVRASDSFGLTDLTLLHPAAGTAQVYDVFRKGESVLGTDPPSPMRDPLGEGKGRPPIYMRGSFPKSLPLLAQIQITAPPARSEKIKSPLRLDWELVPIAGGDSQAPPVNYRRLQLSEAGELLDVMVDLDLSLIEPGEYTLRLSAENLVSRQEDHRSFPISITP